MTIQFEGAKEKRKELTGAIAEITGVEAKYLGAPNFDYQSGGYIIHRNGDVEADDFIDQKELGQLLLGLRARGFFQVGNEFLFPEEPPTDKEVEAVTTEPDMDCVVIHFPKEGVSEQALSNLHKLVEGKGWLIKQALHTDELLIEKDGDRLCFPWLSGKPSYEMITATTFLVAALIKLAKKQTRVTLTANTTDNPRYAFRCFLLRLGFIGKEYKDVRRTLMAGIPGNGSHRHIETAEEVAAREPEVTPEPCKIRKIEEYEGATEEYELSAAERALTNADVHETDK